MWEYLTRLEPQIGGYTIQLSSLAIYLRCIGLKNLVIHY